MDPSASQGGDIGLTENGELASEYEAAAAKLKVGEISPIVKTSYGFHVIKLTDRKKAGMATLEEVRSQLTDFLKGQKENAEVANWSTRFRARQRSKSCSPASRLPKASNRISAGYLPRPRDPWSISGAVPGRSPRRTDPITPAESSRQRALHPCGPRRPAGIIR